MNNSGILPEELTIDAEKLSALIGLVSSGKINRSAYKETIEAVFVNTVDPQNYIAEKGLIMVSDDKTIAEAVKSVLNENANSVTDFRSGKEKVFGFLMGQLMKKLGKGGNPDLAKKALEDALKTN
jgi:aspartyl-tRNA(Asn)/glutamyl-tRNA(Gln) amidotransferase subunit B